MYTMLRGDALRYLNNYVLPTATLEMTIDAFDKIRAHFMPTAHRDTYTTEWSRLTFANMKQENADKSTSQVLDLLFQRARDLQILLLQDPYNSPSLLREYIIRAVKSERFNKTTGHNCYTIEPSCSSYRASLVCTDVCAYVNKRQLKLPLTDHL